MKSLVIAGTQSGVGKTTIATGLMAALNEMGYNIQPFKVGPDYIDPGFHNLVTGNKSRNLDSYFLSAAGVKEVFYKNAKKADLSIIEGVMGLFDGKGKKSTGSTAEIARILQLPVILIINAKKLAQSGGAIAYGYQKYNQQVNIRGVILNKIGSKGHYQMVKTAIEEKTDLEVIGYLPVDKQLELPERHLGLVPVHESKQLKKYYGRLIDTVNKYIDVEKLIRLSTIENDPIIENYPLKNYVSRIKKNRFTLAVAYDEAFNFYYQENLDLLKKLGAELKYFSLLTDKELPEADGVYIGGGFPECFLNKLSKNITMKKDIYNKIENDLPVYAECGGLMYLTEEIEDSKENIFPMVGIIRARTVIENSLQAMGYVKVQAICDNLLFKKGEQARGHVFHYSRLVGLEKNDDKKCYLIDKNKANSQRKAGYSYKNLLASYIHLHFGSNPQIAKNFARKCVNK